MLGKESTLNDRDIYEGGYIYRGRETSKEREERENERKRERGREKEKERERERTLREAESETTCGAWESGIRGGFSRFVASEALSPLLHVHYQSFHFLFSH